MNKMIVAALAAVVSISAVGMTEFEELMKKAKGGDANAMCEVGSRYRDGEGVAKDATLAAEWTLKAASNGCSYAVGLCHNFGYLTPTNATEAVKWYRKAAEQGDEQAKRLVGRRETE